MIGFLVNIEWNVFFFCVGILKMFARVESKGDVRQDNK